MKLVSRHTTLIKWNKETARWDYCNPRTGKVMAPDLPDCDNMDIRWPGIDREKPCLFYSVNVNLTKGGERKMAEKWECAILDLLGIRGRRSHFHAIAAGICFVICAYLAVGAFWTWLCLGFAMAACALGCIRWTLTGITNVLQEIREATKKPSV